MKLGILGAGIAGLSSAYFLREQFPDLEVHEASEHYGGLARSFKWHGFDCDLAPHRLYTDNNELLNELLALVPMVPLHRKSKIYLRGKWVRDPISAPEIVWKYLPVQSARVIWTYLTRRSNEERNFEELVLSRFGRSLNDLFFKPYSEKLFGIPSSEISAEWGRRKIRVSGLRDMIKRRSKLYFKEFYYPRQNGYGATCDRLYEEIKDRVFLNSRLVGLTREQSGSYLCVFEDSVGQRKQVAYDLLISSLPITTLLGLLGMELRLRFRPAVITYLLIERPRVTENHWFYFADSKYIINRVAEFKNFVSDNAPAHQTVLCCEVTDLARFTPGRVIDELTLVGLIEPAEVADVRTIRLENAYPIYDRGYEKEMERARSFLSDHPNLHPIGRQARFEHKDIDEIFEEAKLLAQELSVRDH